MIFTGLSNNWALLQRVNAIEKYLSENPIVPYAKASVAGEGTDTFVFDKSQLSVANGAGLMVGDLIICPDVTLWQVISIADSGEVTARFIVKFQGDTGVRGEKGETGLPALVYTGVVVISVEPSNGTTVQLNTPLFNRFPNAGEHCIVLAKMNDNSAVYIGYVRLGIASNNFVGYWENWVDIKGEQGEQGEQGERGETGPQGETGQQGPQGATGPQGNAGLPALMCKAWEQTTDPTTGGKTMPSSLFSRTPQQGDNFNFIYRNTTNGKTFMVNANYVFGAPNPSVTVEFLSVYDITGPADKLYLHRISLLIEDSYVLFEIMTRSATKLTYAGMATLLDNKLNIATGYAGKTAGEAPHFGNSVYYVTASDGVIEAQTQSGSAIAISPGATITDTVEEI